MSHTLSNGVGTLAFCGLLINFVSLIFCRDQWVYEICGLEIHFRIWLILFPYSLTRIQSIIIYDGCQHVYFHNIIVQSNRSQLLVHKSGKPDFGLDATCKLHRRRRFRTLYTRWTNSSSWLSRRAMKATQSHEPDANSKFCTSRTWIHTNRIILSVLFARIIYFEDYSIMIIIIIIFS